MTGFAELVAATNFSFLRGASTAQDMVVAALLLGHAGLGIADRNTVAGVVRAYSALEDLREGILPVEKVREGSGPGEYVLVERYRDLKLPFTLDEMQERAKAFRLATGTRFVFCDGTPDIVAYPRNKAGWAQICRVLTRGNLKTDTKAECILEFRDLLFSCDGLSLIVMPSDDPQDLRDVLARLAPATKDHVWLGAAMTHRGDDRRRLARLAGIAGEAGVPLVATNDALYHAPGERDLQDVLTCIREGVTIDRAGMLLEQNAERHLKAPDEMARLFADRPQAIIEAGRFLGGLGFSLKELKYQYPDEPVPEGWSPQQWLEHLTWEKAKKIYPDGISAKVQTLLRKELKLIGELDYACYFLTIHDIVQIARGKGILCQGRGSAANSAVCYVLGITAVDPEHSELLFARFLAKERKEPPDIDVDFEHERREEVIQHIYDTYGRDRAAIVATVISYRPKSAIREVGKAFGLSEDITSRLASTVWGSWSKEHPKNGHLAQSGVDPDNPRIARAIVFASRLLGFPRHLSQHVGGFVLTQGRLDDYVPIAPAAMEKRTFVEWDKDDIDRLGMMKVDVLALGMLTCIQKSFELIAAHKGKDYELASVPQEDGDVYKMLQKGDSIGVFQVESRAQINMLPRLKPETFYDLVIQVAIVRPGPIQGNMVHPYLRRREKLEDVDYPSPAPPHDPDELRNVLKRTLGVPLFQEQAMQIAITAAEFSDDQANQLRKAMATFRNNGTIHKFEEMMVEGMVKRGYERDFARRCFDQIKGFGEYGFPESHAASFAKLVYISAWIKCHHPDVFACALLNSQPMGFYAPAQIVRDAREHGVEVRAADINHSLKDNTLEPAEGRWLALRIGLRQIDGFKKEWSQRLVAARQEGAFASIDELWQRTGLPRRAMSLLADADAFRSVGLDRRGASWAARRLPDEEALPLFAAADARELSPEPDMDLPIMAEAEHVIADYQTTRLSLKAHPLSFLRELLRGEGVTSCAGLADMPDGARVKVAGVVLVRQRPGKGNAIFMTIEDETGIANGLMWARLFERYRRPVMAARLAVIEGQVQKSKDGVIHIIASAVQDRSGLLDRLADIGRSDRDPDPAGEAMRPLLSRNRHPRNARIVPKSRDFH